MNEDTTLTADDEGKEVVNESGESIGRVVEVQGGEGHVDPDPGMTDTIKSKLGWGDAQSEDTYRLDPSHIESVTDDEIRLSM